MKKAVSLVVVSLWMLSCASTGYGSQGSLFTQTKISLSANELDTNKEGSACIYSFLGLLAWGDASAETARRNGLIAEIKGLDRESKSYLGIYSQVCTIVKGI